MVVYQQQFRFSLKLTNERCLFVATHNPQPKKNKLVLATCSARSDVNLRVPQTFQLNGMTFFPNRMTILRWS